MTEQIGYRKPKPTTINPETDPNSIRPKPTISSILLSSNHNKDNTKKKNFTSASFRGLGCTASSQVSVPAVIRTSADWESKKVKKKRVKAKKSSNSNKLVSTNSDNGVTSNCDSAVVLVTNNGNPLSQSSLSLALSSTCVSGGSSDVWCGPGIGLSTDAASVDCVVSRRPNRGKLDGRSVRRMVSPEDIPFLEAESTLGMPHFRGANISASRHHHRHVRHSLREGLAEIVMLQSSMMMGGRMDGMDRYRDLRLDVDNMSYEELLELGDSIGYVNTGLREDDMSGCLRRSKVATLDGLFATEFEKKCTICQEEYGEDDETGKLKCGHLYHLECIKLWLGRKNICPICKTEAVSQN